jgi:hypothetical protein
MIRGAAALAGVAASLILAVGSVPVVARTAPPERAPMVALAPDGTGDFGPQTAGTRTAGWQEALDYCVAHKRDLYVSGGFGGWQVFNISDTIRMPASEDFRIDGGIYVLNWTGSADKDLMVVDSAMNCEFHFGVMVYGGTGAALRIRPVKPVPIDNFPVIVETKMDLWGIADPSPFTHGERRAGEGLVLDGTKSGIVHSDIRVQSVINFHTCIRTVGNVGYNHIICPHLHTNADHGTLFAGDERLVGNTIDFTIGVDQGAEGVTGLLLSGRHNVVQLAQRGCDKPIPPGRSLILNAQAEGNRIDLVCPEVADPSGLVTDNAIDPTNQISWTGAPIAIRRVNAPAGRFSYVQRLWPATVSIDSGRIKSLTLVRGKDRVTLNPKSANGVLLSVGDALVMESASPLRLVVVPLKVK